MSQESISDVQTDEAQEPQSNGLGPNQKKSYHLNDIQRSRLFACICVARHLCGAKDDDETFSLEIYNKTLKLMEPHWKLVELHHEPSYHTIKKIWTSFIRTGLVVGRLNIAKSGPKASNQTKGESSDERNGREFCSSTVIKYGFLVLLLGLMPYILNFISAQDPANQDVPDSDITNYQHELKIKNQIDDIEKNYPGLFTPKQYRIIRVRLEMMKREVSILLLLGRSHDIHCKMDPTFCVGKTIANITQYPQFGYIDASDPNLNSMTMIGELSSALDERNDIMMIDGLDQLPGSEVMNLFQFIDRDEFNKKRRGLLLMILYTGQNLDDETFRKVRDADVVEKILVPKWSEHVRSDTLTSVISRISGTIVKVQ